MIFINDPSDREITDIHDKVICLDCDCDKMILSVHKNGMDVICSKCNRRVFFMGLPEEYAAQLLDPKRMVNKDWK